MLDVFQFLVNKKSGLWIHSNSGNSHIWLDPSTPEVRTPAFEHLVCDDLWNGIDLVSWVLSP